MRIDAPLSEGKRRGRRNERFVLGEIRVCIGRGRARPAKLCARRRLVFDRRRWWRPTVREARLCRRRGLRRPWGHRRCRLRRPVIGIREGRERWRGARRWLNRLPSRSGLCVRGLGAKPAPGWARGGWRLRHGGRRQDDPCRKSDGAKEKLLHGGLPVGLCNRSATKFEPAKGRKQRRRSIAPSPHVHASGVIGVDAAARPS
jgi:hypothetical protein